MGFSLKDLVAGIERQLNPFDGGKSFGNPKPASTGDQRNVAQKAIAQINPFDNGRTFNQAQPQNQKSLWQQALDITPLPAINQYNEAVTKAVTPFVPMQVRDMFDANTESDIQKRITAGEAPMYRDQQLAKGIVRPQENIGQALMGNTARLLNTAGAAATGVTGLADLGATSVFGSDQDYENKLNQLNQQLDQAYNPTSGLLNAGTVFSGRDDKALTGDAGALASKVVGSGVGTATEILPMTRGYGAVNKVIQGTGKLPGVALRNAAENAIYGGAGAAAQQLSEGRDINPMEIAQGAAVGGAMGGAIPVAGAAVGAGVRGARKVTTKLVNSVADDVIPAVRKITTNLVSPEAKRSFIPDEGGYIKVPKRKGASEGEQVLDEIINDHAEFLESVQKQTGGVSTVKDADGYVTGRVSSNDPFYRKTFADKGRAPNKAEYFAEAQRQLESGQAPQELAGLYQATKQMIKETPTKPTPNAFEPKTAKPALDDDFITLYKGEGGDLDIRSSNLLDYAQKAKDAKPSIKSRSYSTSENQARSYGDVTKYQVRKSDIMPEAEYEKLIDDIVAENPGTLYNPALWRSEKYGEDIAKRIQDKGYKGFNASTSYIKSPETVLLDDSVVSKAVDKVTPTKPLPIVGEPQVRAETPQAPITTQATPDEIKISTAADNNKQGIKARGKEAREQFVNRFAPVEDLVSKIERETGTPLRPSKNPLSYVRQYLGGGGIANDKIDNALTPIVKQTKEFDGLRQYLVAKRMNELADRGMSKRADNVLADLSAKYGDEIGNFDKIAKELYEYQGKQLDELVDVGVLSRQAADEIRAKNQSYVPFNRVIPDLENYSGGSNAIGRNGNPIKAIKGSDKEIIDPIESMIRNTYDIQATVQKQKVMRSLYELAPDEFTVPPKGSMNKNRVGMFINGEKVAFETSEPLARALNNMAEEQLNMAVRVMSLPAKALRSGATSLNVAFALPNIVRDQLSAAINSKYKGIPVYDFVSGLASVMKKDDVYKNWIRSGADQASFFAQDRTTLQRGVKDITGGVGYKAGKLVKSPLELFRILGEVSEKGSRVGVYKRAEKGAMKEFGNADDALLAAAKESREATIDFARRGSKMKAANSLIPFLNARLQGTLKLANSFKERPVQTASMGMAIAGLPAAALYLHNAEDPNYAEIPDYIKRENFIIMTGNKDTPFIKIPKGEVGKIFGNPVESFLAQLKSEDPSWKSTATSLVDSFLPVGSVEDPGKFVTDLMPTAASVPMQLLANFDTFRGMPIVSQYQKDLPPEQQFSNYNTETGKQIGAALGVSPAKLEFGIGGLTGGLGRQALQIADLAQGNKIPAQDLPVISRFAGEQKDFSKSANEIYDQLEKDKRATARENYDIKQGLKNGTASLEGLDKTKASRLQRSVKEDEIKKNLSPTEKALWGMSKEDLESYSGKYKDSASKVLGLKNSMSTSSTISNPKDKYEDELRKYEEDKKSGAITPITQKKRDRSLAAYKTKADYDKNTVDLYGQSYKDIIGFVNSDENGKKYWEDVQKLDKAMVDAGFTSKLYNKNGSLKSTGTASKGGKKTAKKGGGKGSKRASGFSLTKQITGEKEVAALRNLVKRPSIKRKKVSTA